MICARFLISALLVSMTAAAQQSQPPATGSSPTSSSSASRRFTLDDLWSIVDLADIEISRDAHSVAVITRRANPSSNRFDHSLLLIDVATGNIRTLFESHAASNPHWSSKGQLAFLAHDDATSAPQVFVLSSSGPIHALTNF